MSTTLPSLAWACITTQIEDPLPRVFIRLAQVNRFYRKVFLSDTAWHSFDVYNVGQNGKTPCSYVYKHYRLDGIAGHFMSYITGLEKEIQLWYLTGEGNLPDMPDGDLYYKIHTLAHAIEHQTRHPLGDFSFGVYNLDMYDTRVWDLWISQLHSEQTIVWYLRVDLSHNRSQLGRQKLTFIATLMHRSTILKSESMGRWSIHRFSNLRREYENDLSVNMAMVAARFPCSAHFLESREFAVDALPLWPNLYKYLSLKLRKDRDIMDMAIDLGADMYHLVPHTMLESDDRLFYTLVQKDPKFLKSFGHIKSIVLNSVKINSRCFFHASKRLRSDKEVVIAAIESESNPSQQQILNLEQVYERGDYTMSILSYVPPELLNDKEVMLKAVLNDGCLLHYASDELCTDRELVLAAVRNRGDALQYACPNLQNDETVALAAIANKLSPLSKSLLDGRLYAETGPRLVEMCEYRYHYSYQDLSTWASNKNIVKAIILRYGGQYLETATSEVRDDQDVVQAALTSDPAAIRYASYRLQKFYGSVHRGVRICHTGRRYVGKLSRLY